MNILVCDDDKEIAEAISIYLKHEGYEVFLAGHGAQALEVLGREEIHLIVMDIMMPVMDGIRALVRLREDRNIPVILLSAKGEDTDKILGLNMGADDYITKPFNPMELIARVRSQLRRYTRLGSIPKDDTPSQLCTGGLCIQPESCFVSVEGQEVHLTPVEYKILYFLCQNAGRVFSIHQIYENVWEEPAFNPENTVAVHIRRIREKIEINPKEPRYLKVVWGIGYKIEKIEPQQRY